MFQNIPSLPQIMYISNFLGPEDHQPLAEKGGDFMGIEQQVNPLRKQAIRNAASKMEWEGAPLPKDALNPTIDPNPGIVLDGRDEPTHPLVTGKV